MEIPALLKDITKRSVSSGTGNQTLKAACDIALVHLSSSQQGGAYPFAEVLKVFFMAIQSRNGRLASLGIDGISAIISTSGPTALEEVTFMLMWEGSKGSLSPTPQPLATSEEYLENQSSGSNNTEAALSIHLAHAFYHITTVASSPDPAILVSAIQLVWNAVHKSPQLIPRGALLMAKIFDPLLILHANHFNHNGINAQSYRLLSYIAADLITGAFVEEAIPLDWEFFEPFTCSAATINPLEECAPDDLYEPVSIPARCRPFYTESVGGFTLREPSSLTTNFPQSFSELKDLIHILCKKASANVSLGLSDEGKAVASARRGAALNLLIDIFSALPVANANEEHVCASWLALALDSRQLLICISKNLPTRPYFEAAIHLYALITLKVHFHMGAELHSYLTTVLLPLAQSQLSSFEHKVAIVRCVRNAFLAQPKAVISIFINHDCSLDAIDKRRGIPSGFLSAVIPFLSTLMFTHFSLLSSDQMLLLRQECVESCAALVRSVLGWAAEELPTPLPLDPKAAPLAYHWKHVHHLMQNKLLLQESRLVNAEGGMKKWVTFASDHGFFASHHPAVIARFLQDAPVVVGDEVKHSLANALLKDPLYSEVLGELLALRQMRGQPIDIAFRDFVCDVLHPEGMPQDKQLPESQAWGRLQTLFGNEYAKQNADAEVKLTPYAADALAGSILFLHSATHNANSVMRFTAQDWIDLTVESMGMTVARGYLEPIYLRTVAAPWGTLQTIMGNDGSASGKGPSKGSGSSAPNGGAPTKAAGLSYANDDLTDVESASNKSKADMLYCNKARELCTDFNMWHAKFPYNFYRQPYIVPYYAMHVRPILLSYLPNVVVCLHLGTLSLSQMPILNTIAECFENIREIAGEIGRAHV